MEMSFQQYIDNPLGKRNAVFSQRDLFKNLYTEKFDKLILREAGKINFTLYMDKNKDTYVAHIKIPSETVENFYYDAVIYFYSTDAEVKSSNTLQNYFVKFFSNDPAFVFTYLRVFLKNNLFFEDLKTKASKLALKEDPKIKNPYEVPGYSKILYFAYLFMKSRNLFSKFIYESYAKPYNKKELLKNIEDTDLKISKRQDLGDKQRKTLAEEKKKEKKEKNNERREEILNSNKRIKKASSIKTISNTKSVKETNKTKVIKKIYKSKTSK